MPAVETIGMIHALFSALWSQPWPRDALVAMQIAIWIFALAWSIVFWPFARAQPPDAAAAPSAAAMSAEASGHEDDEAALRLTVIRLDPSDLEKYQGHVNQDAWGQTAEQPPRRQKASSA